MTAAPAETAGRKRRTVLLQCALLLVRLDDQMLDRRVKTLLHLLDKTLLEQSTHSTRMREEHDLVRGERGERVLDREQWVGLAGVPGCGDALLGPCAPPSPPGPPRRARLRVGVGEPEAGSGVERRGDDQALGARSRSPFTAFLSAAPDTGSDTSARIFLATPI
jgi:hypothetical protein